MSKLKLCVIFGGVSSEHEVSLETAASVCANADKNRYDLIKLGITRDGRWLYYNGEVSDIPGGAWERHGDNTPAILSPDRFEQGIYLPQRNQFIKPDVLFPALHGKNGEDGTVQGLFELSGIPYVGCGVASSALCMDKSFTKIIACAAGVAQGKWITARADEIGDALFRQAEEELSYPIFVKPSNTGSSVGISKAKNRGELEAAVAEAAKYDTKILFEEFIDGREIEVAVLGGRDAAASCCGEVLPSREFYSYEAKYIDGTSGLVIPAELEEQTADAIRAAALTVYRAMDCRGLSRVDFFVRRRDGAVIFNEINTMPGFTSISMYPKLFAASGIPYPELIDRLVAQALGH